MDGISGIGHVAIRAGDLERLLDFYTTKLGFSEMFRLRRDDGTVNLVYLRVTDTQYLEFFPHGIGDLPAPDNVGLNHICLIVTDLDAVVRQLTDRGVALSRPMITGKDGNRQAWIQDPEGNRIELMEMSPNGMQADAIARLRQHA